MYLHDISLIKYKDLDRVHTNYESPLYETSPVLCFPAFISFSS